MIKGYQGDELWTAMNPATGKRQIVDPEGEFIPGETIIKLYYWKRKRQTKKLYTSMLVPHTGKDLQKAPLVKTAWLVDGMIPSTGVTFLHGPTTAGKSALTWAIGNAVQTGKPLFGLQTVKTEVLFVSLDMAKDPLKMRWFGTKDKPKAPSSRFNPEFTTIFPKLFPFIEENGDGDAFPGFRQEGLHTDSPRRQEQGQDPQRQVIER